MSEDEQDERGEYNEAEQRVRRAHRVVAAQCTAMDNGLAHLRMLETVAVGNPMFRHTALELTQAKEHLARARDLMDPEKLAEQLAQNICRHCGRKKPADQPYCGRDCETCAKAEKPVGMPCAMICVSNLGGNGQ